MESFETLSTQYTPMIHSIIRKLNIYTNNDEFFQLGLIALWESSNRFDPAKGNFSSYAYSNIKGKIQAEMTKINLQKTRQMPVKDALWDYVVDDSTLVPLEKETLLDYCQLGKLTEPQTKWVLYHFLQGLSVKEIAGIEQVALSTVKKWRSTAIIKIRSALGSESRELF